MANVTPTAQHSSLFFPSRHSVHSFCLESSNYDHNISSGPSNEVNCSSVPIYHSSTYPRSHSTHSSSVCQHRMSYETSKQKLPKFSVPLPSHVMGSGQKNSVEEILCEQMFQEAIEYEEKHADSKVPWRPNRNRTNRGFSSREFDFDAEVPWRVNRSRKDSGSREVECKKELPWRTNQRKNSCGFASTNSENNTYLCHASYDNNSTTVVLRNPKSKARDLNQRYSGNFTFVPTSQLSHQSLETENQIPWRNISRQYSHPSQYRHSIHVDSYNCDDVLSGSTRRSNLFHANSIHQCDHNRLYNCHENRDRNQIYQETPHIQSYLQPCSESALGSQELHSFSNPRSNAFIDCLPNKSGGMLNPPLTKRSSAVLPDTRNSNSVYLSTDSDISSFSSSVHSTFSRNPYDRFSQLENATHAFSNSSFAPKCNPVGNYRSNISSLGPKDAAHPPVPPRRLSYISPIPVISDLPASSCMHYRKQEYNANSSPIAPPVPPPPNTLRQILTPSSSRPPLPRPSYQNSGADGRNGSADPRATGDTASSVGEDGTTNNIQHISEREHDDLDQDPSLHPTAGPIFLSKSRDAQQSKWRS